MGKLKEVNWEDKKEVLAAIGRRSISDAELKKIEKNGFMEDRDVVRALYSKGRIRFEDISEQFRGDKEFFMQIVRYHSTPRTPELLRDNVYAHLSEELKNDLDVVSYICYRADSERRRYEDKNPFVIKMEAKIKRLRKEENIENIENMSYEELMAYEKEQEEEIERLESLKAVRERVKAKAEKVRQLRMELGGLATDIEYIPTEEDKAKEENGSNEEQEL